MTGTRRGMTPRQIFQFHAALRTFDSRPARFLHGDCVGADRDGWTIATALGWSTEAWPAANVHPHLRARTASDIVRNPLPPLERDRLLVEWCDLLIATPGEPEEILRSGTWATIRHARRLARPIILIYPNGQVAGENQ